MKWNNKGHEFDAVYENICKRKKYYLFGAGDYGRHLKNILKDEFEIVGYIDNDTSKQGKIVNGVRCFALSDVVLEESEGIIVSMSQIARVKPIQQLIEAGYVRNEDFYIIEEFVAVYNVYKYGRVYFSTISFLPSTRCNLNCRYCLNFNPYAKQYYSRSWEDIIRDVDLFFSCVDHIMIFHVSGGEPMLYKHTAELIEYIDRNYGDRIDTLRTVTNGTVVPTDETLEKLSKCKVEITVDDYREAVPQFNQQFDKVLEKFEEYGIKYYVNKVDSWIDLAPERTDYTGMSEEQLIKHRDECSQSWQELRDGKLYSCNYAAYATVAGLMEDEDTEEMFDLTKFDESKKRELVEFRLGYTTKGYTDFCKHCKGFAKNNTNIVGVAEQETRKND